MAMNTIELAQLTAPNQTLQAANKVTYAYRRFGNADRAVPPLLCLQHFRGNLDNWDPKLVDGIAASREVILLDNAGVGGSTGITPDTVTAMAKDALAFVDAFKLQVVDVLGFSLGGFVAQELTLLRPQLVRRLVLAGTGPQGGQRMHGFTSDVLETAMADEQGVEHVLALFFERTPESIARGHDFVARIFTRTEGRDAPVSLTARDAQFAAITVWGIPDPTRLNRLAGIKQPTLVANGDNDVMVPTPNSRILAERIPNANLTIYPSAGHGFLFQYPTEFAAEINGFLG
jgi:pimeloyl-ACP methyl ester carboxylesterase